MAFTLNFGKYKNKTFEWLFFHDPGYVWWMIEKNIPERFSKVESKRFEDLVRRAKHLKIPGLCSWCNQRTITRMFLTQHTSGGLAKVDFDCDECHPFGSSPTVSLVPSFFTPDFYRNYDKTGANFMIEAIKSAYFKDPSYRMTQKRMEDFFNDRNNFMNF